MVGSNTFLLACALAALLCVSNVDAAFKCYVCSSVTKSGCSDEFTKSSTLESAATCLGCAKGKTGDVVVRTCSLIAVSNGCTKSGDAAVCFCDSKLCNGSNNMAVSMAALLGATLVVLFSNI
ncbi:protein quiver-like [Dreissena polymorpha]|uniref:protein quiver-like n=1 Tax=Dreissena polymorpha TaxID=45954 RepID=UPI0022650E1B|nr:protein quiver-like [Dreissena polymorpha]